MFDFAYRSVPIKNLDPGVMIATKEGRLDVEEVAKSLLGVKLTGRRSVNRSNGKRAAYTYPADATALVLATDDELDVIEGVIVQNLGVQPGGVWSPSDVQADDDHLVVQAAGWSWTVPLRGHADLQEMLPDVVPATESRTQRAKKTAAAKAAAPTTAGEAKPADGGGGDE